MNAAGKLFVAAAVLIVLGGVAFAMQPVLDPKPKPVCVEEGAPYSGMVDPDQNDCGVSDASYAEIVDWESKPKPIRIAGLLLVIGGIVTGAIGGVRAARGPRRE